MLRKKRDPIQEKKENVAYIFLFFFIISFLVKIVFGVIASSSALLISGIFALFGIFISIVTLIRIRSYSNNVSLSKIGISHSKLEFIIIAGASIIITIAAASILFSIGHMTLFHRLYPPGLIAAWISAVIAMFNFYIIHWIKEKIDLIEEADIKKILFLLDKDFLLSIAVIFIVIISRTGFFVIDYLCAILEALFILKYSFNYLYNSFRGLADASYSPKVTSKIRKIISSADKDMKIRTLKVTPSGGKFEIVVIVELIKTTKIKKAKSIIAVIKSILDKKLDMPYEISVGFKAGDKI